MSEADSILVESGGDDVAAEPIVLSGASGYYYPATKHDPGSGIVLVDENKCLVFIVTADSLSRESLIQFVEGIQCGETEW